MKREVTEVQGETVNKVFGVIGEQQLCRETYISGGH